MISLQICGSGHERDRGAGGPRRVFLISFLHIRLLRGKSRDLKDRLFAQ